MSTSCETPCIVCDYGTNINRLSLTCDAQCAAPTTTKAATTLDDDDDDDDDDNDDILYTSQGNGCSSNQPFLTLYSIESSLLFLQGSAVDPHYNSSKRVQNAWFVSEVTT